MSERWTPKKDERYYYVTAQGKANHNHWYYDEFDRKYYEHGNCFRTKEEALAAAEKVKALLLSLHDEQPVTDCDQLPDWCKQGEWIWYPEDMAGGRYLEIIEIRGGGVYAKEKEDYDPDYLCFDLVRKYSKQARLRPYNEDEMQRLVGKVLHGNDFDFSALILYAESTSNTIETLHYSYTAEELKQDYTIDNKPAGVLEHLENGEWVQ